MMGNRWDEETLREIVTGVLAELKAIDPDLGSAAVERLGFEIVGFMKAQAYDTRRIIVTRLIDLSREIGAKSEADYNEPMLQAHGLVDASFAIEEIPEEGLGIPLGIFRKG